MSRGKRGACLCQGARRSMGTRGSLFSLPEADRCAPKHLFSRAHRSVDHGQSKEETKKTKKYSNPLTKKQAPVDRLAGHRVERGAWGVEPPRYYYNVKMSRYSVSYLSQASCPFQQVVVDRGCSGCSAEQKHRRLCRTDMSSNPVRLDRGLGRAKWRSLRCTLLHTNICSM